ncbi:VOC family protein [Streptomyces pactum]|uniref:Glyoxalase/bleomycin resistance/dioxygenase family protein n=1 Tax=Streptomyces pactum TaxID=68249 RepID=A0A1S6JGZ0_9ACTN|nr:VOC family protein [Streptomyces pactum]AQS71023.1 glyoxalase/bleomycin resistance/dioxygenase family protein [Streptomyces pactum]
MLRLGIPVVGVTDLPRAVAFWTAALNLTVTEEWASDTWRTLVHADGSGHALGLLRSESPAEPRPRLHLDLYTDTAEEQRAEVRRLIGLGARTVDWDLYPPDPDFVVLADPDDNIFCVVDLSHAPSGGARPAP